MLSHYAECIHEMGTPDNYSTEAPEYLHIKCMKWGWRASNKVRPTLHMVRFIQQYEVLQIHRARMNTWLRIDASAGREQGWKSRVVYDEEVEDLIEQRPVVPNISISGVGEVVGDGNGEGGGDGDGD
ncbi:hypothetical protein FRC06_000648, partial [Ceratobasidium sp. 370]